MRTVDMDLAKNNEHEAIIDGVADLARRFRDDYRLQRDNDGLFPTEFHRAIADGGIASVTRAAGAHGHENRADHGAAHHVLHRREGSRSTKALLMNSYLPSGQARS